MIQTIRDVSTELIARLAEKNWPPLAEMVNHEPGQIIVTTKHTLDQFLPPRVIFVPQKSVFTSKASSRGLATVAANANGYDAQSKQAIQHPALLTEMATFEVSCWSIASEDEEDDVYGADYDYTLALYHEVIASCHAKMAGCFTVEGGYWRTASHVKRPGREFVFGITIHTEVLKDPPPRSGLPDRSAPSNVAANITDSMVIGTGDSSPGCED